MSIGFIFGLLTASAFAEDSVMDMLKSLNTQAIMMTGKTPSGLASVIQVDEVGYVICSDHRKP